MICYIYKPVGAKRNLTKREIGDISENAMREADERQLENWDRFMRILKEV